MANPCACRELPVRRLVVICAASCGLTLPCPADPGTLEIPAIFSDHMVLQRSARTAVWGRGTPDRRVTVRLGDDLQAESTPGADGRWRVDLDTRELPPGPHTLRINDRTINDVLLGEVWLCGGQSNMEFVLANTKGAGEEMRSRPNPMIRQFLVPKRPETAPQQDIRGEWMRAEGADFGRFTAVGYYFAKHLAGELGTPVGLINATWGASACETWMSPEAVAAVPGLAEGAAQLEGEIRDYPEKRAAFIRDFGRWMAEEGRQDKPALTAEQVAASPPGTWSKVDLPRRPAGAPAPGSVWFRRMVDIPPAAAGKEIAVMLGNVQMLEEVFWNGERVGGTTLETFETGRYGKSHKIPARLVRAGANDLLVRVWSAAVTPHFMVADEYFRAGPVPLGGEWLMQRESELPPPASPPPPPPVQPRAIQNTASRAFNGMINPLAPFTIAGVIWYQGENNAPRAAQYREVFPALIRDWRKLWGKADLPFFWCQLANYRETPRQPGESTWAELREAQSQALALPQTGQVVTIDVGEARDIHPRDKATPGKRLADLALARVYGRKTPVSGPVFAGAEFGGGRAVISFDGAAGGLEAAPVPATQVLTSIPPRSAPLTRNSPDSPLEGFALCGTNRVWHWAEAVIDGDTVVVRAPGVPEPVAVRYAWSDNPIANLRGKNGLPAAPFRSDDFPLTTQGTSYP